MNPSRRQFIKAAGAAGAFSLAFPSVLGASNPGGKLNIAAIGGVLEEEFRTLGLIGDGAAVAAVTDGGARVVPVTVTYGSGPDSCPACSATPLVHEAGCKRCLSCDWTTCG
jgi:hypothetical protein